MDRRGLLLLVVASGLLGQEADTVRVVGAVKRPLTLKLADLKAMPRAKVSMTSGGVETVYEGVWLHEVLKKAGVAQGAALRGKALSSYVLAEAEDGYQVVFSLAELDPAFQDSQVLLADTGDGKPLIGAQGHFRLVVPKDKPGARSVRLLVKLEVVQLRK